MLQKRVHLPLIYRELHFQLVYFFATLQTPTTDLVCLVLSGSRRQGTVPLTPQTHGPTFTFYNFTCMKDRGFEKINFSTCKKIKAEEYKLQVSNLLSNNLANNEGTGINEPTLTQMRAAKSQLNIQQGQLEHGLRAGQARKGQLKLARLILSQLELLLVENSKLKWR